jgi:hypothetical protein
MKRSAWISVLLAGVLALALVTTSQATSISFYATADNQFTMYLSTNPTVAGTQIGSGTDWSTTYSGSGTLTPGVTNYLQVYGVNAGAEAGFIGQFTLSDTDFEFANGTQYVLSNATDWFVSATGYNAAPNVATDEGQNGVGPWFTRPNIDTNARWIWTDVPTGDKAYISIPIYSTFTPVPLPPAVLLLGSGLIGLAGWRRLF